MDAGDSWRLGLLLVCLALSAFFSASETAFVALPRARLLHLVRLGGRALPGWNAWWNTRNASWLLYYSATIW